MIKFFENISWKIIFAAFMAVFFLRNLLMPVVADDYSYKFIWDGAGNGNLLDSINPEHLQLVESFSDIFYSQWQHYFSWGGRSVAHFLAQFFVWQGKIFFDVANTLVFAALIFLIFKIGTGLSLRGMNKSFLLLILFGMYFCSPTPLITTIWLTGACNYLWMSVIELLFLLPLVETYRRKKLRITHFAFLIAFLAGWSIEPGAAVTIFVTFMLILDFRRKKILKSWMKISFAFLLLGFAILILAPGNFHRSELIEATLSFKANFFEGFLPVFLRESILFLPIAFYFLKAKTSSETSKFILIFSAASILSLTVMMFVPIFPERAGFPSTIFLLIASLAALKEILPLIKLPTKIIAAFAVVWCLSLLGCLYVEFDFHNQLENRQKIIAARVNDDLIVPAIKLPAWSEKLLGSRTWDEFTLILGGDLSPDDFDNRNITFARYHGLKRIVTYLPQP